MQCLCTSRMRCFVASTTPSSPGFKCDNADRLGRGGDFAAWHRDAMVGPGGKCSFSFFLKYSLTVCHVAGGFDRRRACLGGNGGDDKHANVHTLITPALGDKISTGTCWQRLFPPPQYFEHDILFRSSVLSIFKVRCYSGSTSTVTATCG